MEITSGTNSFDTIVAERNARQDAARKDYESVWAVGDVISGTPIVEGHPWWTPEIG